MSSLSDRYDLAMLDLDGVVYIGPDAVPGAAGHIQSARDAGLRVAFITNNASRPPEAVVTHLVDLGVSASVDDVVTSAQAAAQVLLTRLAVGAKVALLGGEGLVAALRGAGLEAVAVDDPSAEAIVSGYGPDVLWRDVMRAGVRIREGLWWVASNTDATIPTPYGVAPGHGVLVDTLRRFAGVEPEVAGKPARPLLEETVRRMGAQRPLMVGDRLDTDIAGGVAMGIDTLLVMTGVTGLEALVTATPDERPTYVAADLSGLTDQIAAVVESDSGWSAGGWTAGAGKRLEITGSGSPSDWWRVVSAWGWGISDRGEVPQWRGVTPPTSTGR